MPRFCIAFAAVGFLLVGLTHADAGVLITVNKSTQRLSVDVDGTEHHEWPVSTARWGYNTPNGTYRPERLARQWYSRKYDWSPMPYSIFFHGGYAIHGSYEISRIGRPASHGCIRLYPKNAAVLFRIVQAHRGDTRIVVTGERPTYRAVARRVRREETSARRHPYHRPTVRRHYRERVVERRVRRQADFGEVFAPPPRYGGASQANWRQPRDGQSQRDLQRWWYDH